MEKKDIILILIVVFIFSVAYTMSTMERNGEKVCYDLYSPVCGVDGNTYGNDCYAEREGVEIAYEGECNSKEEISLKDSYGNKVPKDCVNWFDGCNNCRVSEDGKLACTLMYCDENMLSEPECKLYEDEVKDVNEVEETDIIKEELNESEFKENETSFCPAVYAPVCGVDGNTYGNDCEANVNDVEIAYSGECSNSNDNNFESNQEENLSIDSPKDYCEKNDGNWVDDYNECEMISLETCENLGGDFFECGSACRHEEGENIPCTLQCVPYCKV